LKKVLHVSKKLTKFSIYLGLIIFVLVLILDLNIKYFKNLIEEKLSVSTGLEARIENLSLGYNFDSINIQAMKITLLDESSFPNAEILNINLELTYENLFKESAKFSSLAIDTLKINLPKKNNLDEKKPKKDLSKFLISLGLFQKISIEQTLISSKKEYEIGEINVVSSSDEIDFYVNKYPLDLIYENSHNVSLDVKGKFSLKNMGTNEVVIPLYIITEDFKIDGELQINSSLRFYGDIDQVDVKKSLKYFPQDPSKATLIENFGNAIKSGYLRDSKILFEKNLLTDEVINNKFDSVVFFKELSYANKKFLVQDYHGEITLNPEKLQLKGKGSLFEKDFFINVDIPDNPLRGKMVMVNFSDVNSEFQGAANYLENENWEMNFSVGTGFSGNLTIPKSDELVPVVIIENLVVPDGKSNSIDISPADIPAVTVIAKKIIVGENELPKFELQLMPSGKILRVSYLKLSDYKVDNNPIKFNGGWLDKNKTIINANLQGENLKGLLTAMGIDKKIQGGKYNFDIRLYCNCNPWEVKLDSISGEILGNVEEGIFTDQDPSIGRIFSLLNIDSISRRLRLNVDDLISKGFAYDTIKGRAVVNDKKINIDFLNVDSTSNHIKVKGHSNLKSRSYELEAYVRPEIADSVPVATYLAGGGLAGLGVWLADKTIFDGDLINKIIDKVVEIKYSITGPWDNPEIKAETKFL
jgi:hypothetical protein